ncbi:Peptidyl-prolyl cis-trans isomerase pin4 [Gnomoniopsis smithogilvyi]|uniref:Peptidyl-prolyl cis-trans isomerase n=1 Tax=Gnomoniopsis smithogilvyi TaxID=1191159 RepID=A0A9W8YX92_9PEZI|nr:Peptidyl-prolyl cis-trans isomerase pin4 [Gnomoniopsis smithogilvyi]
MAKNKGGDAKSGGKGAKGKGSDEKDSGSGKKNGLKIKIRHILCEKHAKKEEALAKLREGVKFDQVAREYSEDKAKQGGNLGEMTKDRLEKEFVDVAWALEPSTVDSPVYGEVKTAHGYHIIMVEK